MSQGAGVDFGATLRQARVQRGVSLREISDHTKISKAALEALERNDVSMLPGGLFSRSFVRAYAREVGLDPETTVKAFIAAFPGEDPLATDAPVRGTPRDAVPIEQGTAFMRAVGRVFTVVVPIALVVGYVAWSGRLASWRAAGRVAAPAPASAPAPPVPSPPAAPPEETVVVKPGGQPAALPLTDQAPPSLAAPAAPIASLEQVAAPDLASLPEGMLRLSLAASGRCWVSLRSDGIHVFAGTMEAGDKRDVDAGGRISLTVGDAGVFSYSINGQPARPMGGAGEVVTVVITAQNYKTFLQRP